MVASRENICGLLRSQPCAKLNLYNRKIIWKQTYAMEVAVGGNWSSQCTLRTLWWDSPNYHAISPEFLHNNHATAAIMASSLLTSCIHMCCKCYTACFMEQLVQLWKHNGVRITLTEITQCNDVICPPSHTSPAHSDWVGLPSIGRAAKQKLPEDLKGSGSRTVDRSWEGPRNVAHE